MSDREQFEKWAKSFYKEQKMSLNSEVHFARPNEYMMNHYQSAWDAWQASSQVAQDKITALEASNIELQEHAIQKNIDSEGSKVYLVADLLIARSNLDKQQDKITALEARNRELESALSEINKICYVCKQDVKDINTIYMKSKQALSTTPTEANHEH